MRLVIFGASGPSGLELCRQALAAGHQVTAAVRRPADFPIKHAQLTIVEAHVMEDAALAPVIGDADAALSTLGAAYSRREIRIYSVATEAIVAGMRASAHCRRLVVVSSGLTPRTMPKTRGFVADMVFLPLLKYVIGRTLYQDMLRMEEYLATCDDIAWTIMCPGRLVDGTSVSAYRVAEDFPAGDITTRPDLAAAMLAELGPSGHVHNKDSSDDTLSKCVDPRSCAGWDA